MDQANLSNNDVLSLNPNDVYEYYQTTTTYMVSVNLHSDHMSHTSCRANSHRFFFGGRFDTEKLWIHFLIRSFQILSCRRNPG